MEAVFENVCKVFGFQGLNKFQIEAITHILEKGIDIFVNLPTGYGKSVIHRSCNLTRSLIILVSLYEVYERSGWQGCTLEFMQYIFYIIE